MRTYCIGDCSIIWDGAAFLPESDEFTALFEIVSSNEIQMPRDTITFRTVMSDFSFLDGATCVFRNSTCELFAKGEREYLVSHWARCRFAYGIAYSALKEQQPVECLVNPAIRKEQPIPMVRVLSTLGLHSLLLQRQAAILHCAFVLWNGRAILFAGASGSGKSTQANLWKELENIQIINEDRAILRKKDGRWHAFGYPCCGSSRICHNETAPVAAIVMLQHGKENTLSKMTVGDSIREIFLGTQMLVWSREENDMAFALAQSIATELPIYRYACTPDAAAVKFLKELLITL